MIISERWIGDNDQDNYGYAKGMPTQDFFYLVANGRRRANQIQRLKVGEQEYTGTQVESLPAISGLSPEKRNKIGGKGGVGGEHAKQGPTSGTSKTILRGGSPRGNKRIKCRRGTKPGQPSRVFFTLSFWG